MALGVTESLEVVFVEPEVVPQFVKERDANFFSNVVERLANRFDVFLEKPDPIGHPLEFLGKLGFGNALVQAEQEVVGLHFQFSEHGSGRARYDLDWNALVDRLPPPIGKAIDRLGDHLLEHVLAGFKGHGTQDYG